MIDNPKQLYNSVMVCQKCGCEKVSAKNVGNASIFKCANCGAEWRVEDSDVKELSFFRRVQNAGTKVGDKVHVIYYNDGSNWIVVESSKKSVKFCESYMMVTECANGGAVSIERIMYNNVQYIHSFIFTANMEF